MWGRYYCLRVYNQPLTEQQVQNNYNVDHDLFFQ
jgi:hypothetical protein